MHQDKLVHNPFMLMLQPEQVLAAVERSEKLGRLNRRLCHPLDRPAPEADAAGQRQAANRAGLLDGDDAPV